MAVGLSDNYTDDIPTPFYVKKLLKLFVEQINHPMPKQERIHTKKLSLIISSCSDKFIELFQQVHYYSTKLAMDALQQDSNIKALEIARFYHLDVTQNLFNLLKKYPKH